MGLHCEMAGTSSRAETKPDRKVYSTYRSYLAQMCYGYQPQNQGKALSLTHYNTHQKQDGVLSVRIVADVSEQGN